jgi:ribosomal protein S18 acetylase RimI-like enzyme
MIPYSLRPAFDSDLEAMMRIGHEGIRPYAEQLWKWDQADQERRFREGFDLATIRIVQIDDRDAGYLKVEYRDDHVFLAGIYLAKEHRCRGIGSQLIVDLLQSCRDLGKPLRLRVLRPNPAQRLYRRLGFRTVEQTETHIYMEAAPVAELESADVPNNVV